MSLDDWMAEGDLPEVDWSDHLHQLSLRGALGAAGRAWLLDLPALAQPHACRSGECTPGQRLPRTRSCCADLAVDVTDAERKAIADAWPEIREHLASDPRWASEPPRWLDGGELQRPGGRCVFALSRPTGLSCGLHELEDATGRPRGALKPMPCRLFPLVVVDLGDGRRLLTAVHTKTARRLGHATARLFPCLRDPAREPLATACRDTLNELLGSRRRKQVDEAVAGWLDARA